VQADYRLDGTETLMVCTVDGEGVCPCVSHLHSHLFIRTLPHSPSPKSSPVRGFQPIGAAQPNSAASAAAAPSPARPTVPSTLPAFSPGAQSPEPGRMSAAIPAQQLQRAQRTAQDRALKDLLQQRNVRLVCVRVGMLSIR